MNMNRRINQIAVIAVAAASLSFAQQGVPQQGTIVYVNGQAMLLTPVQTQPMQPMQAQPVQYTSYPQQMPQMASGYIAPQPPPPPQQSSPYGAFPRYVGEGANVAGSQ